MNHDEVRRTLEAEITALVQARDAMPEGDERQATNAQINRLQDQVDTVDVTAADQLGAKVDAIIAKIDEVLAAESLDAASALGRTAERLRALRSGG